MPLSKPFHILDNGLEEYNFKTQDFPVLFIGIYRIHAITITSRTKEAILIGPCISILRVFVSTEEPVAETEKKDDAPKKAPKKTKKVAINGIVSLSGPTAIYRGPGVYPFAKINGVVKPLGDADETGYTKVQCVISGTGVCEGYIKL